MPLALVAALTLVMAVGMAGMPTLLGTVGVELVLAAILAMAAMADRKTPAGTAPLAVAAVAVAVATSVLRIALGPVAVAVAVLAS